MATSARHRTVFSFGLFEADPASGELLRQGDRVRLQDQPFRMLMVLLERPGEVITREELRQRLWPEHTFVEFDSGLKVALKKIRDALGDSADNPRFIETIPRRGYRFVAPVSTKTQGSVMGAVVLPADSSITDKRSPSEPLPIRSRSWRPRIYIAVAVLTALAIAAILLVRRTQVRSAKQATLQVQSVEAAQRRSLAVMSFHNVSGRPENNWLSTAISEMLSTELAAGEKLRLIPGEDVVRVNRELHLEGTGTLARDTAVRAGKSLRVDVLVLGSYTTMGSGPNRRLRVDVRMQDARNGEIVAEVAETSNEQHLFELISRAGARLRKAIGAPVVSPTEEAGVRASMPSNSDASRLYAQGLSRLRILDGTGARDLLEHAVAAEPKFPLSHAALASAWRSLGYDHRAESELQKALDLSSNLPRADRLLIEGRYHEVANEMDKAIAAYRALFTLFPDSLEDGLLLADAENRAGRTVDSLRTSELLRRLPDSASEDPRIDLLEGRTAEVQGNYTAELAAARRAIDKAKLAHAPLLLAAGDMNACYALKSLGQQSEAADACHIAQQVYAEAGDRAEFAHALRFLADIKWSQGKLDEALDLYRQVLKTDRSMGHQGATAATLNEIGLVYESQGNLREAERYYRQSYSFFSRFPRSRNAIVLACNVGGILLSEGKLRQAGKFFEQAMALARQSGNTSAEAGAHGLLGEMDLVRGDLGSARLNIESALALETGEPMGHVGNLDRLSKILAAQGDLAGARRHRAEAISTAEKIGANGLVAEYRAALAELDLEEGRPAQAEQPIRDAIAVFHREKMHDDELRASFVLVRCLLMRDKVSEARALVNQVRGPATRSQNPVIRLLFAMAEACAQFAAVDLSSAELQWARSRLLDCISTAANLGFTLLQYQARLALAEIELRRNPGAGERDLVSLEEDAKAHGFGLIAGRAAKLRVERS